MTLYFAIGDESADGEGESSAPPRQFVMNHAIRRKRSWQRSNIRVS